MERSLNIVLLSTDYPPLRTSAAVQLRDLAQQFAILGHNPVVIIPSEMSEDRWQAETVAGVEIVRVAATPTRASTYLRRALAEMLLPFVMLRNIRKSPHRNIKWDIIVWYSPPIFFAPLVFWLKRGSSARTYLILRDIFPEWAVDLGIISRGPVYYLLKFFAALQYAVADVIGVQTPSNLGYMVPWAKGSRRRIEVLPNWLATTPNIGCSISIASTSLAGRTIFAYIGNMGVAQGMDIFMALIESLRDRKDIGFVFVGRGTELANLVAEQGSRELDNVLFFDEIDSLEIPGLLAQSHVGMVALHPDHKSHNIPGKFVSYIHYGLPILARVNAGTDLIGLIEDNNVGRVYVGHSVDELKCLALELADDPTLRAEMSARGQQLGQSMFSPEAAAKQIIAIMAPSLQ